MKIAVTGARGFVGKALISHLLEYTDHEIVALSRSQVKYDDPRVSCRAVDFYSMKDAETALKDCDIGIYLIHSMLPSNRLSQGHFADFDFILADNFARAANHNALNQIIYVGGIVPHKAGKLSKHLQSRLEVEEVLEASGVPVTVLRSSMIIGNLGSSFIMLKKLVYRLPLMGLPAWAQTPCQPIYIKDVIHILANCIDNPKTYGKNYDCGSNEVLTYRKLIELTAEAAGLSRRLISIPNIPIWSTKLWVCFITGASRALVSPLVDSLKTPMVVHPQFRVPDEIAPKKYTPVLEAIKLSLPNPQGKRPAIGSQPNKTVKARNEVRSVQRLPLPGKLNALAASEQYLTWLPKFFSGIVYVKNHGAKACFKLIGLPSELLTLSFAPDRSTEDRHLFYITGGLLSQETERGRLEFRASPDKKDLFAAIHDYKPSLPWWIYLYTQALLHKFVMYQFARHLERIAKADQKQD